MKHLILILFLISSNAVFAQADIDERFFCDAQDRLLTDEDFVRLALGYELQKMRAEYPFDTALPEGYEIRSVDGFLELNPDSYTIDRDPKNMRNQSTSWLARFEDWLDGEQIAIWILVPASTSGEPMLFLTYFVDECGEINLDRSFRITNDFITE